MSTIVQTINERHIRQAGRADEGERHGTVMDAARNVVLFLLTPVLGLAYAVGYGAVGMTAVMCYGLKAFGVSCGIFKR